MSGYEQQRSPNADDPPGDPSGDAARAPRANPAEAAVAALSPIEQLFAALGSDMLPRRTRKLSSASMVKKAKKLVEEASEMSFEAVFGRRQGVIEESADMLYHMVVLWRACGVRPGDVWREMHRRAADFGLAEKRPKSGKRRRTTAA